MNDYTISDTYECIMNALSYSLMYRCDFVSKGNLLY